MPFFKWQTAEFLNVGCRLAVEGWSPPSSRLPSNIPLRTLPVHHEQSASLLAPHNQRGHRVDYPGSDDDEYSESSSWTDTGDIAEQLDADDPIRQRLNETFDDEILAGVFRRHPTKHEQQQHKQKKRVRYREPSDSRSWSPKVHDHDHDHDYAGVVSKEAIHIPDATAPRNVTRAERLLAAIMTGGSSSSIHGLTGKALIYFTSIFVSLGVFLFGYDQGVMSGIITGAYFLDYFNHPSSVEIGTMVAILEIGAFISSLIVGRLGDILGRRKTIFYGSCIFFVGGALQTLARNMMMMMLGRIIAGLGVGMLSTIVPVYQSEISPPHNRGKLACIEFSGNIIGYTTSVWVDYFCGFIEGNLSWRLPLMMQCIMGALLALGSLIIVESPRWLLDNDHDEEGIVVIANLYGGGDIHNPRARDEFREIKMDVLLQRQEGERTYSEMFKRYRTRVFIAMSAQALAQLNGINVISYYAPYVFESAGWVGHDAVLMAGFNGITYFLSTIPPWYIVDRWGRRPILLSGAVMMVISLSLISYFIYIDIRATPTLVVIMVMIYNAAFGYSWGPVPWLYPPEILPLKIRSKGASLSTATNWAFNWLVGEMTPVLQEWIKWRLYLVHAFFCAVSFVVVYFTYPETCGVRLEDMDALFGDATGALGTPAIREDVDPLMGGGGGSGGGGRPGVARGHPGQFGPASAIPGLDIGPPSSFHNTEDDKQEGNGGFGGWMSALFRRKPNTQNNGGQYAPLGQGED
ncbi:MFS glucose transporter mfs1 [Diplogelasinospora grovesii]|uniref:MFS glucose transporter mfs1 n=1 Tax=Diplogelasinospora grovesii TaxID=303347 RepID=A0AAN6S813_9PEZI|nr:MFS glucose transporter mfs1 [Diplogelasinospora grovesii]